MASQFNRIGLWIDGLEEKKVRREKSGEISSQTKERDVTARPWPRSVFIFNDNRNGIIINDGDCKALNGHNVKGDERGREEKSMVLELPFVREEESNS